MVTWPWRITSWERRSRVETLSWWQGCRREGKERKKNMREPRQDLPSTQCSKGPTFSNQALPPHGPVIYKFINCFTHWWAEHPHDPISSIALPVRAKLSTHEHLKPFCISIITDWFFCIHKSLTIGTTPGMYVEWKGVRDSVAQHCRSLSCPIAFRGCISSNWKGLHTTSCQQSLEISLDCQNQHSQISFVQVVQVRIKVHGKIGKMLRV